MRFVHPDTSNGTLCFENTQALIKDGIVDLPEAVGRGYGFKPAPPIEKTKNTDPPKPPAAPLTELTIENAGRIEEVNADRAIELVGQIVNLDVLAAVEIAEKGQKKTKDGRKSVLAAIEAQVERMTAPKPPAAPLTEPVADPNAPPTGGQ